MTFIDSNVPMYVVGAPHPNKDRVLALLAQLVGDGERLVTDVEVYQEILHRYIAIRRLDAIDAAFASLDGLADEILTFSIFEVRAAKTLLESVDGLSARDALHASVMSRAGIHRILSFDRGFDLCPGISRLS